MNKEEIKLEKISYNELQHLLIDKECKRVALELENKQLKEELNQKNKIIAEIKTLIENYKHLCKDKGLNMHLTICMIEDILSPKGSEE